MREPLAFRLRPKSFADVVGQEDVVNILQHFVDKESAFSFIFYGPPGTGKTTLALLFANSLKRPFKRFNAVTDNKKDLEAIFFEAKINPPLILICDELQRLNKDKQDLLLPYMEEGIIILLGATTANPLHAINPAIRSRCQLLELKALNENDLLKALNRAISSSDGLNDEYNFPSSLLKKIVRSSGGDLRCCLNTLEIIATTSTTKEIKEEEANKYLNNPPSYLGDKNSYYDYLSAFQKSIRGSDVNAALYYLACLLEGGELESVIRRLMIIAYEDIGLASPALVARTYNACMVAREVGVPEAIIPLGTHIIDLTLSAKSRTGASASERVRDLVKKRIEPIPNYLHLTPINLKEDEQYHYDNFASFVNIAYLPTALDNLDLLPSFANNRYEQQLKQVYQELKKIKRYRNLKELYKKLES